MKEIPMLFTGPMIRAILSDHKSMTRRKKFSGQPGDRIWVRETWWQGNSVTWGRHCIVYDADKSIAWSPGTPFDKPDLSQFRKRPSIFMPRWASRITLEVVSVRPERLQDISEEDAVSEGIERLFTQEEILKVPGIRHTKPEDYGWKNYLWHGCAKGKIADNWPYQYSSYESPIGSFSSLWDSINKKRGYGWDTNLEVKVVEFRRVK